MALQYTALIFALGLTAAYAGYCSRGTPNCCLEKGIGKRSCNGSGTSDLSDLFGALYTGEQTVCISGKPGDAYRIWNFLFEELQGIEDIGNFFGLLAYLFQVPCSNSPNNTDFNYYLVELVKCPKIIPITCNSVGVVAGTGLTYARLLEIVEFNNNKYFPARCQVIDCTYRSCASDINVGANTRLACGMSGLSAFQHVVFDGEGGVSYNTSYLPGLIDANDYYVDHDPFDGMFYQAGYPHGACYACVDPYPNVAYGYGLEELAFNFNNMKAAGQVCLLSQTAAQYAAQNLLAQLYFTIMTFVTAPGFECATIIYAFVSGNVEFPALQAFHSIAC